MAALADDLRRLPGPGPARSARVWPGDLRAAFPGPRQLREAWVGEGAAFARYAGGGGAGGGGGPLFLKYLPAGWRDERAYVRLGREAAYLRDLAPLSPVPHARFRHAASDPARLGAHLVTEDLTDATTGWGAFATDAERETALEHIVRLLARHHAFWLDRPELRGEWDWDPARAVRRAGRVRVAPDWTDGEGSAVREAAEALPTLLADTRGVTLAHGDLHAGQVLWSRVDGSPILIDYGQTHAAPLGEDLAHLLYVRLSAPDRARLGPRLREAYLAELAAHGVHRSEAGWQAEERAGLALNVLATAAQAGRDPGSGVREALARVTAGWHGEG
ncbi:aminoglycoside phosphotransferase family protein [Deinococcus sp. SDU3-2]|uniref:Aminoglycoside phosphotransferase family protein n=1 Tax=Deinococcus terrestris TaxID=2651870 RepID=A0A7X1NW71_9DEIO|nr:aminoglycoside phosphotransferase family protein [Deinococcus terrestris]